eukprot:bmy_20056T0
MEGARWMTRSRFQGHACLTNLPSDMAFRGFGFPQGTLVTDSCITAVAAKCGLPPEKNACQILLKHLEPIIKKNPEGTCKDWKIRTDIVMDACCSLNPATDIGQIEGSFIQGMGLYTTEEVKYSPEGVLYSRGPDEYKIPTMSDVPEEFNVSMLPSSQTPLTIYSSKADAQLIALTTERIPITCLGPVPPQMAKTRESALLHSGSSFSGLMLAWRAMSAYSQQHQ